MAVPQLISGQLEYQGNKKGPVSGALRFNL